MCLIVCDLEASKTKSHRLEVNDCPIENKYDQLIISVNKLQCIRNDIYNIFSIESWLLVKDRKLFCAWTLFLFAKFT